MATRRNESKTEKMEDGDEKIKSEVKEDGSSDEATDDEKDTVEEADIRDVRYRLEFLVL